MEPSHRSLAWYLLAGTRGGPNRLRILETLRATPCNAHRIAQVLSLDYRTARHHLGLLERSGLVVRPIGKAYASPYELSPRMRADFEEVRTMLGEARASPGARRVLERGRARGSVL
jgi:DNA-binding transcriptional ArsR family regulator